jgi:hypothetical protein
VMQVLNSEFREPCTVGDRGSAGRRDKHVYGTKRPRRKAARFGSGSSTTSTCGAGRKRTRN